MNRENVLTVAADVEAAEDFDQDKWYHWTCGTPACIAGHAHARSGDPVPNLNRMEFGQAGELVAESAQRYLGLSDSEAFHLFDAAPFGRDEGYVPIPTSKETAATVLRLFAVTGQIKWEQARALAEGQPS